MLVFGFFVLHFFLANILITLMTKIGKKWSWICNFANFFSQNLCIKVCCIFFAEFCPQTWPKCFNTVSLKVSLNFPACGRRKKRKKERKKETRHAPFAKGTGEVRRTDEVTAFFCEKKPFDPCDLKSKFEPISFEEGPTWCICMSYIDKLRNIEEIMHIRWKWPFDSCDPKWPQVDLWPHNIGRGSQANVHVWIVWSCYIQRTNYSTFSWKWHFDPCDPKWPQWIFRLITLIQGI